MNDYTLYLVKRAYYKKQLIKRAFMNKYALSEESAKNIDPALLERFRAYEEAGKKYGGDGEGSIRDRLMARALAANGGDRTAANSIIVNKVHDFAGQNVPYLGPGNGLTAAETAANEFKFTDALEKGKKKLLKRKGSKSTALVPYVAPVTDLVDPTPSEPSKAGVPWGRYATIGGSSLAGAGLGYAGSNWLSKKLGLKGQKSWRRAGDIALRTLGTAGGAVGAGLGAGALYDRYVK